MSSLSFAEPTTSAKIICPGLLPPSVPFLPLPKTFDVPCSGTNLVEVFLLSESVLVTSPLRPVCFQVLSPIVILLTATPAVPGLSFHLSLMVTSPFPFAINFLPSSENLAFTPGEDDRMVNLALASLP